MKTGFSFLHSKLGRRFLLFFILCAFVPTVALVVISYRQVVSQIEEQSYLRLKRDVIGYSVSLYDRLLRIANDLDSIGRFIALAEPDAELLRQQYGDIFEELFDGFVLYRSSEPFQPLYGTLNSTILENFLTDERLKSKKPFLLALPGNDGSLFYIGQNIMTEQLRPFTVIAEVKSDYLFGFGPSPLLPPMTELVVYDRNGNNIITSMYGPTENYRDLAKTPVSTDLQVFQYVHNDQVYHGGISNIFLESRFQDVGWTIILSIARQDVMAALDNFKQTFPFIILFFLLVISYLSLLFIRKGLTPLQILQKGTQRIAQKDFATPVEIRSGDEFEDLGRSFNEMAGKLDNHFQAMTLLNEIDRAILSSLNRRTIIATTLQRLKSFFQCDLTIYLKNVEDSVEHITAYRLEGRRMSDPTIEHYQISLENQQRLFTADDHVIFPAEGNNNTDFLDEIQGGRPLTMLCLPLAVKNRKQRALLLGYAGDRTFNDDELYQARKIANQLAIALANSILVEDLATLAKGTIAALARTVDAKSKWTHGHSERVAEISVKIAKAMRLSEDMVETIGRAGLLHDIGKIGIPLSILDKPSSLNEDEYASIKNHPEIGAQILEPIEAYHDIIPILRQHHEKFDGSGYPAGLKDESIDIRARIMAVADVWDALVSERPYREGWVSQRAKDFILEGKGTHFDPKVVDIFMTLLSENQPALLSPAP